METVLFKSNSKKDMNLLVSLAKKIGVEVEKIASSDTVLDENSAEYELKVEKNLGKMIKIGLKSGVASKEEVLKVSNTQYQVFRVDAESDVDTTTSVLNGSFEKDKIWLLLKMKNSIEFDSIFSKIRDQESNPAEINEDQGGHY